MAPSPKASAPPVSITDLLIVALWWGLLTALGEGYVAPTYIWHDLMRAGVEVEPGLFLIAALILIAFKRRLRLGRDDLMQTTFLFSGLTVFACLSRSPWAPPVLIALLTATAVASLLAFFWFLRGPALVTWQKRSLPLLLLLALWCVVVFPIKQRRHEQRDLARLPSTAAGAPNVLVIVVDTLRADHLSTYGYTRPTSPHLSQFAAQGTLFQNAIAPSSWTLPVHASLLTGLYPEKHNVENDGSLLGWHYPTLGEEFMARGYRTAAFSGNTLLFCRRRGFGRGFIHFEDDFQSFGSSFAQTFYGDLIKHLLFGLHLKADLFGRRSAEDINRHALRWIDSDRRPFFVFLNYMDVHDPYRPPEPYLHRYTTLKDPASRASEHWDWFAHLTPRQRQGAMDAYDGAINYVDDHLYRLMEQLRQRGLDRNTLVVVTSDHGESFGEHGLMTHGSSLYRELIHVPLIFWAPGRIPAETKIDTPVSLTALPATLLEEAGEARHPNFPQLSLAHLWNHAGAQPAVDDPLSELAQLNWNPAFPDYYGPMKSVSTAHWHYIHGGKFGDQLFPCCADQPEQLNLAGTVFGQELTARFERELASGAGAESLAAANSSSPPAGLHSTFRLDFEPVQLALADFDNNGDVDIMVRGRNKNQLALLLGDGKGGFQPAAETRRILREFVGRRLATAKLSLASCRSSREEVSCAWALADDSGLANSSAIPSQAWFTDVNGDGLEDLALGSPSGENSAWLRADARNRFHLMKNGRHAAKQSTGRAIALAHGDIDGNGMEDLAFVDEIHHAVVFLVATGTGVFSKATLSLDGPSESIALADLDHNGKADLVVINPAGKSVTVMLEL
ncbi:MAG TPA: sulfatase-like hydrolase/transferase [Terriglobales bacterium]|nr:sulfatase-like hydrolase/transferase [Terriglobales bacterium]